MNYCYYQQEQNTDTQHHAYNTLQVTYSTIMNPDQLIMHSGPN